MSKKKAIIVFNLGGPDNLSSVKAFLFNLFYDPCIITLPNPFRWILAKFISSRRENKAKEIYKEMGGRSPILPITEKQAALLEAEINDKNVKVFVSMRYWHPFAKDVVKAIEKFEPEEIVFLPLYPQYSTTTTKSSFDEFLKELKNSKLKNLKISAVNNYHKDKYFIKAHLELINEAIKTMKDSNYRILFSAHSLPEYIIERGDPYKKQIEETVDIIVKTLPQDLDYKICYQSKVGPLKWLSPSSEDEIIKAAKEGKSVIIVPIAFVSEHSETLVELDIEYKELFSEHSTKQYHRVPALNYNKDFILALKNQIADSAQHITFS